MIIPLLAGMVTGIGCKNKSSKITSIVTSVYEVKEAGDTYAAGALRYMEEDAYKDGWPFEKTFYNADQSIRGREVYLYKDGNRYPFGSKYYGPDGKLQSRYEFEYKDSLKMKTLAYRGDSDELLRSEVFEYDKKGRMIAKTILNEKGIKEKSFLFTHDQYGNESLMVVTDKKGEKIASEIYEITKYDAKMRWLERYGYIGKSKVPKTFYKRQRND